MIDTGNSIRSRADRPARPAPRGLAPLLQPRSIGRIVVCGAVGKTTTRHLLKELLLAASPGQACRVVCETSAWDAPSTGVDAVLVPAGLPADPLRAARLLENLTADQLAIVWGDCPRLARAVRRTAAQVLRVGRASGCDLRAAGVAWADGCLRCVVEGHELQLPWPGRHHLGPLLCAVAAARVAGAAWEQIARAVRRMPPLAARCEVVRLGEFTLVNDTCSNRAAATRAALRLLPDLTQAGRSVFVCDAGCAERPEELAELGRAAVRLAGVDWLLVAGELDNPLAAGARAAGLPRERLTGAPNLRAALQQWRRAAQPGDVVLLKSRRRIASGLVARWLAADSWPGAHEFSSSLIEFHRRPREFAGIPEATLPPGLELQLVGPAVTGSTAPTSASRWNS